MVRLGREVRFHKCSRNISVQKYDFNHKVNEARLLYFRWKWNKFTFPHSRYEQNFLLMISFAYVHPSVFYEATTFLLWIRRELAENLQFAFVLRTQNSAFILIGFPCSFRLLLKLEFKFPCDQFPVIFSGQVFCNRSYFTRIRSSM
jgi:hypothetical protein